MGGGAAPPVRLDQLITTKAVLDLRLLLAKDSTFYGDLFPHVIHWRGELYLEDGLHRALARPCTSGPCCTPGCSIWTPGAPAAALTQAGSQRHGLNRAPPG